MDKKPKEYLKIKKLKKDIGFLKKEKIQQRLLKERFLIPPFSILSARDGNWQRRKKEWVKLGIKGDSGRGVGLLNFSASNVGIKDEEIKKLWNKNRCGKATEKEIKILKKYMSKNQSAKSYNTQGWLDKKGIKGNSIKQTGISIFDPVLTELMYLWFCIPGGKILDPFAGGSTRGIVAEYLSYQYTGIEIRKEQIEANENQADKLNLKPNYIHGDSFEINNLLPKKEKYDLVFACPPYFDLEVYSEMERDGSVFKDYNKFMDWYFEVFKQCVDRLKDNSFLVIVVGEIRDKQGIYRNFVGDTIDCFLQLDLKYYNEIILMTAIGSLPIRVTKQFISSRKIGKTHQNILVFFKGDAKKIKEKFNTFE